MAQVYDVVVIGGGAAGLWALRGLKDRSVIIIEGNDRLGAKLLATGGGKCNFTNRFLAPEHFISSNPHFIKSFLHKLTTEDVLDFVEGHGIPYEERDNGKLFTLSGATSILEAILEDGKSDDHTFLLDCLVQDVEKIPEAGSSCGEVDAANPVADGESVFCIETTKGKIYARKVIVASGGLSYPRLGATNIAAKIARKFGMRVLPMVPALAGLRYPEEVAAGFAGLAGIAVTAEIALGKRIFRDQLLFTHRGFSGPLALNASLFVEGPTEITVDFVPGLDVARLIEDNRGSRKSLAGILSEHLPKALVRVLLAGREYNLAQVKKSEVEEVAAAFNRQKMVISQVDGYDRAEVTRGGVSVDEIFPKTMESRTCPGLYFIGESLDVTGMLGGYNLHWAWASAQMLVEGLAD
ncbi:MAG: aminoacetone oxidase family FAD-binding enzyme [Spirochaetaceae bacterium]|nr:aminoacetone oxidase family FAD-binding enzyme [Spirochaetaceae bacterium]